MGISFNGTAEHKVLITQQTKLPPLSKKLATIKKADVFTSAFTQLFAVPKELDTLASTFYANPLRLSLISLPSAH
ncbi:hypothetical protein VroAM7_19800 [Vibrio rotiferianus]|uniref:Uncharacterized protein n=1 Tax=Vibrio rotiferianus TaxID=190895 RepID=A0A510I700_9VIBR|nr:hypothetical protein VroAM7_19800 [Vibrio rotiferianus]